MSEQRQDLNERQNELIDAIQRLADEIGEVPSLADMKEDGEFSGTPYYNHFKSWTVALEIAGYQSKQTKFEISESELVEEVRQVADETGRTPRMRDMRDHGEYSHETYHARFDGWREVLEKAGFRATYDGRIRQPGELIEEMLRIAEIVDRPPFQDDMREHGEYDPEAFVRQFGSWGEALEFAGLPGRKRIARPAESDAANAGRYGSNWEQMRLEALYRDRWCCQDCGVENAAYVEEAGKSLDVHHIIPIREFDNAEDANFLLNLISLCESCHKKWEPVTQAGFSRGVDA